MSLIDECKSKLPLPELMQQLGYGAHAKKKAHCPWHEDKNPSFSTYRNPRGDWKWRCHAGCGQGDEIDFIQKTQGIDSKKAIVFFANIAGVNMIPQTTKAPITPKPVLLGQVRALRPEELTRLTQLRGYRTDIIKDFVVLYNRHVAFPVQIGYHYKVKATNDWRYSPGAKSTLFQIGETEEGAPVHVFESQWDALAFADVSGERNNIVATRGASNTQVIVNRFKGHTGTLYLWSQNDPAGHKWESEIRKGLGPDAQVKACHVPDQHKDLNDWTKAGATADELMAVITFPAPVLAEPKASGEKPVVTSGEAVGSTGASNNAPQYETPTGGETLSHVLDTCVDFLTRYVHFEDDWQPKLCALWAAHTWTYDCFAFTPYLHIYSPDSNCGKSTLLNAIGKLSRKPWTPVASSDAALYIKIEQDKPTLLMDEVDAIWGEKTNNEQLRAIIDAGYSKTGMVPRAPRGVLMEYSVYTPKALAGIGQLPTTLENRSIHVYMQRQPPDDRAARWRTSIVDEETKPMRDFFTTWVPLVHAALQSARPDMPADLDGRHMDILEPLLAIADEAGGEWPRIARESAVEAFVTVGGDSDASKLLRDIRTVFLNSDQEAMASRDIVKALVAACEDAPWAQWWERSISNMQFSAAQSKLAKILKTFHISPKTVRAKSFEGQVPEDVILKGYHKSDFTAAWKKFLPPLNTKMETGSLKL